MQNRDNLFEWAIPCGTWFGVRVRVSPLFVVVAVVLCLHQADYRVGLLFTALLLVAVLIHELAHVFALRLTGGGVNDLLLWPLGGVTKPSNSSSPDPVAATAAGPMASLAVCCLCLAFLVRSEGGWGILNPLELPAVDLGGGAAHGSLALLFFANWLLVVANLVPAVPLDAGRGLETALTSRFGNGLGHQMSVRIGAAVGIVAIVAALGLQSVWLCALGGGLLAFNLRESHRQLMAESFDESFMGYDFSQGYTSLERSVPVETEVRPGLLKRWLTRRRAVREERSRVRAEEAERELDLLLSKVHTFGIDSLTDTERRTLKRASARYRGRSKS